MTLVSALPPLILQPKSIFNNLFWGHDNSSYIQSTSRIISPEIIKKNELMKTMESYNKLDYGWMDYSSVPISNVVIRNAMKLLNYVTLLPEIYPTGRNTKTL